jgi:hypothetical protein
VITPSLPTFASPCEQEARVTAEQEARVGSESEIANFQEIGKEQLKSATTSPTFLVTVVRQTVETRKQNKGLVQSNGS